MWSLDINIRHPHRVSTFFFRETHNIYQNDGMQYMVRVDVPLSMAFDIINRCPIITLNFHQSSTGMNYYSVQCYKLGEVEWSRYQRSVCKDACRLFLKLPIYWKWLDRELAQIPVGAQSCRDEDEKFELQFCHTLWHDGTSINPSKCYHIVFNINFQIS